MQALSYKQYVAELLGTGILTFMVLSSLYFDLPLATPIIAGLTLGLCVYAIGGLSGSHINPAVTVGLWSIKKINTTQALFYVVSQVIGAALAMAAFRFGFGALPSVTADASVAILIVEAVGAAMLLFGICSVVFGKVSDAASGLVIGGSLLLGILLAAGTSNGVLNPAVAIGIGSVSWAYIVAPFIGAIGSCWLYRWLVTAS